MNRLLDSMSFQRFIEERGPSYRHCDVFDDLYADIQSQLKQELEKQIDSSHYQSLDLVNSLSMQNLKKISEKLYKYEFPQTSVLTNQTLGNVGSNQNKISLVNKNISNKLINFSGLSGLLPTPNRSFSKIKLPTADAYKRIHSESFPMLDSNEIQRLIRLNITNSAHTASTSGVSNPDISTTSSTSSGVSASPAFLAMNPNTPRNHLCRPHLVPYGPPIETVRNMTVINKGIVSLTDSNSNIDTKFLFNQLKSEQSGELDSETSCLRKLEAIAQVSHRFKLFLTVKMNF